MYRDWFILNILATSTLCQPPPTGNPIAKAHTYVTASSCIRELTKFYLYSGYYRVY